MKARGYFTFAAMFAFFTIADLATAYYGPKDQPELRAIALMVGILTAVSLYNSIRNGIRALK